MRFQVVMEAAVTEAIRDLLKISMTFLLQVPLENCQTAYFTKNILFEIDLEPARNTVI